MRRYIEELRGLVLKGVFMYILVYVVLVASFTLVGKGLYFLGVRDVMAFYLDAVAKLALILVIPPFLLMFYGWLRDALTKEESRTLKKYIIYSFVAAILSVIVSFYLSGQVVFYLARTLSSLVGAELLITPTDVIGFLTYFTIIFYILFHLPLILKLLIRYKLLPRESIEKNRPIIYTFIFIFSAILSPGDLLVADVIITLVAILLIEGAIRI